MGRAALVAVGACGVGMVAGVAIGLVLGDPGTGAAATAPQRAALGGGPAGDAAEAPLAPAQAPAVKRRHAAAGADDNAAQRLLDTVDIGPLPTGDGTITGHVRTADGHPVAGIEIVATPGEPEAWDAERDVEGSAVTELTDYARILRWGEVTRVTSVTSADGAYALSGIADLLYQVSGSSERFRLRRTPTPDRDARLAKAGAVVDFLATPLTKASFIVSAPGGDAPEQVQIRLRSPHQSRNFPWRTGSDAVEVAAGAHTLTATAGEFDQLSAEAVEVTFEEGRTDQVVHVELRAVPGIGGTVTNAGPIGNVNAQIWRLRVPAGTAPSPGRLVQTGTSVGVWLHKYQQNARYIFSGLAPGTYALGIARQNELPRDVALVEVSDGFVRRDLVLPDLDRNACIEIAAFAPDGSPITSLGGSVTWTHDRASSSTGFQAVKRSDGTLWVPIPRGYDAATGTHTIRIDSPFGSVTREYTPGPGARVEIHFQEPARGSVRIAGYVGSGVEGRVVIQVGDPNHGWPVTQLTVDAEGRGKLPALAPGPHTVSIATASKWGRGRTLVSRGVVFVSGENSVTLSLPALNTLTVELSGEVGSRMIGIRSDENPGGGPVSPDEYGRAVFDLLPAGEYTIQIYNGEGGSKKVTIPGTTLVRF